MRLFKTNFGAATAGLLLFATLLLFPLNARAEQSLTDCDIDGNTPSYIVSGLGQSKLNVSLANGPTPVNIPPGQYRAVGASFDELHSSEADQAQEQWFATFYGVGGIFVGSVSVSPDLPMESQTESFPLYQGFNFEKPELSPIAPLTLTGTATAVTFQHAFLTSSSAESVFATCIGLTPTSVPDDTTSTTSTTSTTTPPVTEGTTTTTTATTTTTSTTTPPVTEGTTTSTTTTVPEPEATPTSTTSTSTTITTTIPPTVPRQSPVLLSIPTTEAPTSSTSIGPSTTSTPTTASTSKVSPAFVAALVTLPLEVAGLQVNPEEVAYTGSPTVSMLELSIVMLMIGLLLLVMARSNRPL